MDRGERTVTAPCRLALSSPTASRRHGVHAPRQDRQINTPLNEESGKRGGTHNSLTRIFIKPTHLAGGYAQFAYAFNYYGPTGNNRDEVTVIRRRSQEVQF